tara:strand:- start:1242 stop:1535 length:294 start_codon:yes stop_codon:yes gene_type:complete
MGGGGRLYPAGVKLDGFLPVNNFPKKRMDESDQANILSEKISSALDWAREELDMTYVSIIGVLEMHKFLTLCELYSVANSELEDDEDEEEGDEESFL